MNDNATLRVGRAARCGLADDAGGNWQSSATRTGRPVGNSQCTVNAAESRVTMAGDQLTVEFAVRFAAGWKGSKLVYAYANSFGDTRNTGWKEVGSWLVAEEREDSAPQPAEARGPSRLNMGEATAAPDPNDAPTKELDRTVSDYQKFLAANAGATELTHRAGSPAVGADERAQDGDCGSGDASGHNRQMGGEYAGAVGDEAGVARGWDQQWPDHSQKRTHSARDHQTYTDYTTKHDSR